jgi:hypothetical protein
MEILTKPALHESRDCFAKLYQTESESVAAHSRYTHGSGDSLDYRGRGREIGVTGTEVDDVHSASDELALFLGDSGEWVFGKAE